VLLLTKASKFALYALVEMALATDERVSAKSIAERFGISTNHVAKVLQALAQAGLVDGTRGAGGGYAMSRSPTDVSMADVIDAIEGPVAVDACSDCPVQASPDRCETNVATCNVHALLTEVRSHARFTFESVTIQTLAQQKVRPSGNATRSTSLQGRGGAGVFDLEGETRK
jgi:Rrf2 family protein